MVKFLQCGFIAQQCSVPCPRLMPLFLQRPTPAVVACALTLLPRGRGTVHMWASLCDFPLPHNITHCILSCCIIDAGGSVTWLQYTRGQWISCRFLGDKRIFDYYLPVTMQSTWGDQTDSTIDGPVPCYIYRCCRR
jgi:hypothetical protein